MGNMKNCLLTESSPLGSQIIQQLNNGQEIDKKPGYVIQKKLVTQTLQEKVKFFYIHPLSHQIKSISPQYEIQTTIQKENHQLTQKSSHLNIQNLKSSNLQTDDKKMDVNQDLIYSKQKLSINDEDGQAIQDTIKKVSVQWNSFAKIKKKSYLQDYIFIKQIGRGAYGSVCKIKMKYGGLLRAAKIIKLTALIKEKQIEQKFLAEIALPIQMDHPNIIKLFEVFEWKKQLVLVMQLCQGGDLFNRIKQNKVFSQKKASQIMKQILSAVFYMHKKNIMHRDIKPQNMLYDTQSKSLKIIDFGTAIKFKPGQKLKNLSGTPYYVAPEVIKGKYDQKCDVWSCGVILYILLCGYPPFNGKNQKQIMQKIGLQPIQFNHSVWTKRSSKAKLLIQKMLTKKSQDRISAEQALNSDWIVDTPTVDQQHQIAQQVCINLKSFQFQNKLKAVVYTYIASQLYSNKDKEILLKAFRQMDKDGDGVIGKDELMQVFNKHSTSSLELKQIQKILQIVDTNGSGLIDFTEFLVAASNQEKILERQRLQNAFNYLDTDHSGFISMDQVKEFLDGTQQTNLELKKIFDEVDDNGDGQISKKQFISLLLKKT